MPSLASRSIRILRWARPIVGLSVFLLTLLSSLFWMSGRANAQGSHEIPFYKHTIDLEQSEAAEVGRCEWRRETRHYFRRELVRTDDAG